MTKDRRHTAPRRLPQLAALVVAALLLIAACNPFGPEQIYQTTSVGVAVSAGSGGATASVVSGGSGAVAARSIASAPQFAVVGAPDPANITLVTLTISGEDKFGVFQDPLATAVLTNVGGIWQATVDDLPIGPALTFAVEAFDAGGDALYSGSSTVVLGAAGETVSIDLYPVTDGTPVVFPIIQSITRPAEIIVDTSETVSVALSGTANEDLEVSFGSGGGTFTPNPAIVALSGSGTATLDALYGAPSVVGTYDHSVSVTNEQGNSVTTAFQTVVVYETGSVDVVIGIAPAIIGLSASRSGSDVSYTATVTDDRPLGELIYSWSFVQSGGTPGVGFADPAANPGTLGGYDETVTGTVSITVTDGDGLSTTVTFALPAGQFPDAVVADSGAGTSEAITPELFEPYFNVPVSTSRSLRFPDLADFDANGKLDVLIPDWHREGVFVAANYSDPAQMSSADFSVSFFPTGPGAQVAAAHDFDQDGLPDIVVGSSYDLFLLRNTSTGAGVSFDAPVSIAQWIRAQDIEIVDLNADGLSDIVLTGSRSFYTVEALAAGSDPASFGPIVKHEFWDVDMDARGPSPFGVEVADFNQDGRPDVAVSYRSPGNSTNDLSVLQNVLSPDQTIDGLAFTNLSMFDLTEEHWSLEAADFDGDGLVDIASTGLNDGLRVLRNIHSGGPLSTASFSAPIPFPAPVGSAGIVAGDLNGDLRPDLVSSDWTGDPSLFVYTNTGAPGTISFDHVEFPIGGTSPAPLIGDLNGDGSLEIIVVNDGEYAVSVFEQK